MLDPGGALSSAIIQDRQFTITPADFSGWEILNNSFKPYAACHLTHPAIDAARSLRLPRESLAGVEGIDARVGALAHQITGGKSGAPETSLEGKFDLKYCVALALAGRTLSASDFSEPFKPEPEILSLSRKVDAVSSSSHGYSSAAIIVRFSNGEERQAEIAIAKGHPGNPMTWADMRDKFRGLIGSDSQMDEVFNELRQCGSSSCRALQAIERVAASDAAL